MDRVCVQDADPVHVVRSDGGPTDGTAVAERPARGHRGET